MMQTATTRQMRGQRAFLSGKAAEDAVAAHYLRAGHRVVARRWRGASGEIDMITEDGAQIVFVEVKQADSFAEAAERLSLRQQGRIYAAAAEFLAGALHGQASACRFDVALVDGTGRIEILQNAFGQS